MQISTSTGVSRAPFYDRSNGRLRYETHIPKEMRYKGATPSGNFLDDYETSRAYAVEFLRACDGTAKVRPENRGISGSGLLPQMIKTIPDESRQWFYPFSS